MRTKEEIQKEINDWMYEINGLVRTAKQMGNKNPYDNFLIKDRLEIVEKLKKEMEELKWILKKWNKNLLITN